MKKVKKMQKSYSHVFVGPAHKHVLKLTHNYNEFGCSCLCMHMCKQKHTADIMNSNNISYRYQLEHRLLVGKRKLLKSKAPTGSALDRTACRLKVSGQRQALVKSSSRACRGWANFRHRRFHSKEIIWYRGDITSG